MTITMNPQKIIERLADKTLSFGCRVMTRGFENDEVKYLPATYINEDYVYYDNGDTGSYRSEGINRILGHPILIGDIIFKINQAQVSKLVKLWRVFGDKSLQEIAEENVESTLQKQHDCHGGVAPPINCHCNDCNKRDRIIESALELFKYLDDLKL